MLALREAPYCTTLPLDRYHHHDQDQHHLAHSNRLLRRTLDVEPTNSSTQMLHRFERDSWNPRIQLMKTQG